MKTEASASEWATELPSPTVINRCHRVGVRFVFLVSGLTGTGTPEKLRAAGRTKKKDPDAPRTSGFVSAGIPIGSALQPIKLLRLAGGNHDGLLHAIQYDRGRNHRVRTVGQGGPEDPPAGKARRP